MFYKPKQTLIYLTIIESNLSLSNDGKHGYGGVNSFITNGLCAQARVFLCVLFGRLKLLLGLKQDIEHS